MDLPYATMQDSLHYIKNFHVSRCSFAFFISCHHSSAAPLEWDSRRWEANTLQNKAQLTCSMSDTPWGPMSGDMSSDKTQDMYNRRPFLWWAKNYNGRQILSVGRHVGCVSQNAIFFTFNHSCCTNKGIVHFLLHKNVHDYTVLQRCVAYWVLSIKQPIILQWEPEWKVCPNNAVNR